MNPESNQKNITYGIIAFFALAFIGAGAYFFLRSPKEDKQVTTSKIKVEEETKEKEPGKKIKRESYTLVSHNTADIQTNPIEYSSVLKILSDPKSGDKSLQKATKKLLEVDYKKEPESSQIV